MDIVPGGVGGTEAGERAMRQYRPALLGAITLFRTTLSPTTLSPRTSSPTVVVATLSVVTALSLAATAGHAEPCPHEVVAARAALGPTAPQSLAAQMHRQPTVASVAAAEKRLTTAFGCPPEKPQGQRRSH